MHHEWVALALHVFLLSPVKA